MTNYTHAFRKKCLSTTIVVSSLLFAGTAFAQIEQQTGIADPGRANERLLEEKLFPQGGPKVQVKSLALQNAPEGAENIKFNFGGLQLEGAGEYSEDELYSIYSDMIGTEISLAELYGIANRMSLKYRNDGFILTQVVVPPQTIEDGIAKLQIVEGYISNVRVQGETLTPFEADLINSYANQMTEDGALNIAEMEHQLLLINDLPGIEARTIIGPAPGTPGAAEMLIIVERDPFEAVAGVNNHGSRFLGPVQFTGASSFNSLLGFNEQINLQAVAAPDAGMELAFGSFEYKQPVGKYGTILSLGASITDTDPGYTLSQFEVEGLSKTLSVKAEHPFIRSRDFNVSGRVGFDLRSVDSKNNVQAKIEDRIRTVRAGVKADFLDRLASVAVNTIDLQVSKGTSFFGASDQGDANMTRAAGDPQFTKYNLELQRLQRITKSINVLLAGRGQLSNSPLLSSEEFALGGISTVRGYEPSEVVGDDGIAGKIELRWQNAERNIQTFGFLDSGTVWNQDANNSAAKRNSLTSTGLGVRVDLPMDINAELVASQPLHRDISTQGERDPQFFFSLNKEF